MAWTGGGGVGDALHSRRDIHKPGPRDMTPALRAEVRDGDLRHSPSIRQQFAAAKS